MERDREFGSFLKQRWALADANRLRDALRQFHERLQDLAPRPPSAGRG